MKTKSALNQFLILICVVLVSFFIVGMIGTVILSSIFGISLKDMANLAQMDYSKPGLVNFLRGLQFVQFISFFLIPTFVCTWMFTGKTKKYLGWRAPFKNSYFLVGVGLMLIAIPFTGWLGEINRNIPFPNSMASWMQKQEDDATRTIQALLSQHTITDLLLNLVCIAGFAAVGEELLFRGMAQRLLIKMFKSPWAGIIISAALFSAMHMQFYGFLPRFALGILLGLIYWYSGSLWVAILAHFIYDAVLIIVAYNNPSMITEENSLPMKNLVMAGSISLVLVILLVVWMKKNSQTSYQSVYADDGIPEKNHPFDFDKNPPE